MKKTLFVIFLAILLSINAAAQNNKNASTAPDLSGTWILDEKESIFTNIMRSTSTVDDRGSSNFNGRWEGFLIYGQNIDREEKKSYENYALVITQKESEIKIIRTFTFEGKDSKYEITLFTDKRGEQNTEPYRRVEGDRYKDSIHIWLEDTVVKSETSWKKRLLERKGAFDGDTGGPNFKSITGHLIHEKYSLSEDGKILTLSIETQILFGVNDTVNRTSRLVFRKKES